jgi:tetratricopeptide (TPR) repeat protein
MFCGCQSEREASVEQITLKKVTFRVNPKIMPDTAKVYISGNNSLLGNWETVKSGPVATMPALERQPDGIWTRTFLFPQGLKVGYLINRGSHLSTAVDADGNPIDKAFFTVQLDTTIDIEVANWKDNVVPAELKSANAYLADLYYEKAKTFLKAPLDSAFYYLEKAKQLFIAEEKWENVLQCYRDIGVRFRWPGHWNTALQYCKKALQIGDKLTKPSIWVGRVYLDIGIIYHANGDYQKSLDYLNEAERFFQEHFSDTEFLLGVYGKMAEVSHDRREYDKALKYYLKKLALNREFFGKNHQNEAHEYISIGQIYAAKKEYDKAIEYFQKGLAIFSIYYDERSKVIALAHHELARVYALASEFEKAENHFIRQLTVYREIFGDDHSGTIETYLALAEIAINQQAYSKALKYLRGPLQRFIPGFEATSLYSLSSDSLPDFPALAVYQKQFLRALSLQAQALYEQNLDENLMLFRRRNETDPPAAEKRTHR